MPIHVAYRTNRYVYIRIKPGPEADRKTALALQNLGIDAFAAIREFPLSRPADDATIVVTVNGDPVGRASCDECADGWTYDPNTNTIYFGDTVVPAQGDLIEVSYTALCL